MLLRNKCSILVDHRFTRAREPHIRELEANTTWKEAMKSILSSISLANYQQELVDILQSDDTVVFLDTNLLAWGFRLNNDASLEFTRWLENLAQYEHLVIPAWTVHEYNHHLLRDDPTFFQPHKSIGKQLNANLAELIKVAHLMISDESATELGYTNRESLFSALSESSKVVQQCVAHLAKDDVQRRRKLVGSLETLRWSGFVRQPEG